MKTHPECRDDVRSREIPGVMSRSYTDLCNHKILIKLKPQATGVFHQSSGGIMAYCTVNTLTPGQNLISQMTY